MELVHATLNFVHSQLQGAFVELNMLSQLGYHGFNPDKLTSTEASLTKIEQGLVDFYNGQHEQDFKDMIPEIQHDLLKLAGKVKRILSESTLKDSQDDVRVLIATLARSAYTRDHLTRGILDYARFTQNKPLFDQFASSEPDIRRGLEGCHLLFSIFTGEEEPKPVFYKTLMDEGASLPGQFRSQAHEGALLLFAENFSFSNTDIPEADISAWESINMPPQVAGFWHAYLISPALASEWIQSGVVQPQEAWFWSHFGFLPIQAKPWKEKGFPVLVAKDFLDRGYTPEGAIEELKKGA
mgnify:FL=1